MSGALGGLPVEAVPAVLTVGLLLIYLELNRPGRVIPGALGLLLTLLACARLVAVHPRPAALVLLATATALLAAGLVRAIHAAVAVAATLALVLGFRELVAPPVGWMICILCGAVLGGVTAFLTRLARRAKVNKAKQ